MLWFLHIVSDFFYFVISLENMKSKSRRYSSLFRGEMADIRHPCATMIELFLNLNTICTFINAFYLVIQCKWKVLNSKYCSALMLCKYPLIVMLYIHDNIMHVSYHYYQHSYVFCMEVPRNARIYLVCFHAKDRAYIVTRRIRRYVHIHVHIF